MSTAVSKYFTTREKKIAIALMVAKLGLQDRLPTNKTAEAVAVDVDQPSSSPILLSTEDSNEDDVDDDAVLGEIFNTPDCPPSEDLPSAPPPSLSVPHFTRTVLSMKGLVGMLKQCQTNVDILETGDQSGRPSCVCHPLLHQPGVDTVSEGGSGGKLL